MKTLACALLAFVLLAVAGCGSENLETIVIENPLIDQSGNPLQGPFEMQVRGTSVQLNAIGIYTSDSRFDITNQVTWTSSAPSILTVNTVGVVTTTSQCTSPGTLVTITASKGKVSQFINILADCVV